MCRGLELAVAVMGDKALTVTEIEPRTGFYDYEAKYGDDGSVHILPARIPPRVADRALRHACAAHAALGCRGVTRSDLRYDDINDLLVLLEVNTQPGMTPTSLAPEQAAHRVSGSTSWCFGSRRTRMPAALRGERRGAAKPRTKVSPKSARPRPARAPSRGVSKLRAAHGVGLSAPLAVAAASLILALGVVVVLATGGRGQRLVAAAHGAIDSRFASLGLRLGVIHLQGASPAAQAEILKAAALKPGQAILGLDLAAVRARVERVGWVERARVIRLLPDTLVIAVDERPLLAVWEHAGRTVVIATDGTVVTKVDPGHFAGLPLIVGDGANAAARNILPAVLARPRLAKRLDALVRVDDRRWDLRLKDGCLIQLPATGEETALKQLDDLDRASRILELGFARIDLRDPEMVAVRPQGGAAPVLTAGGV